MNGDSGKIDFAFLDSGTGGIPYMLSLHEQLPDARCVYLGDTAEFPYGEKSLEEVTECASKAIKNLVERWNPKAVVIACNTISVTALANLRKLFPQLPIVGTVPAIKLAAKLTKNKRIGLLATNATVNHPYCQNLIDEFAADYTVIKRGDPALIDFVEKDYFTSTEQEKLKAVKAAADFFLKENCDTVILGCTHFTHISEEMKKACGPDVTVVDSRDGVARQAAKVIGLEICGERADALVIGGARNGLPQGNEAVSGTPQSTTEAPGLTEGPENLTFYVTAATEADAKEYKTLCKNMNIPWGGILK